MNVVGLSVEGTLYRGWKSSTIVDSIEQLARTFRVSYTEDATEDGSIVPIEEGDDVQVKIDDDVVISGYVDDSNRQWGLDTRGADVAGRSYAGDIVDCSAAVQQWRDLDLATIAQDLCDPFGLSVTVDGSAGANFRKFSTQIGETVHEALNRAAKMRGLLVTTDAEGNIIFTRAGTEKIATVLKRGVNIKNGSVRGTWRDRYSEYTVKAQSAGDDDFFGIPSTQAQHISEDTDVSRYRPLIIVAENEDSGSELEDRANWERNTRAGQSRRLSYIVYGWRDDDSALWRSNTLIQVEDEWLDIKDELLITSVMFERSLENGTVATLELTRPEAFDVLTPPTKKKGSLFGILG